MLINCTQLSEVYTVTNNIVSYPLESLKVGVMMILWDFIEIIKTSTITYNNIYNKILANI